MFFAFGFAPYTSAYLIEDQNMKKAGFAIVFALLVFSAQSQASLINFNATGVGGISGYVQMDDSLFDGSTFQFISNASLITDLSLNVFGQVFSFADVVGGDNTIIDSSGLIPSIVNGGGNLANNGIQAIAFFPDGYNGTASDGDASLAVGAANGGLADESFYAVQWVVGAASVPAPAPLALMGLGLIAMGYNKKRKAS